MQYQLSDEDSVDSDTGIRFKTTNTRNKTKNDDSKIKVHQSKLKSSHHKCKYHDGNKERSEYSKRHKKSKSKENKKETEYNSRKSNHGKRSEDKNRSDACYSASLEVQNDNNESKSKVSVTKEPENEIVEFSKSHVHGPALPPHLLNLNSSCTSTQSEKVKDSDKSMSLSEANKCNWSNDLKVTRSNVSPKAENEALRNSRDNTYEDDSDSDYDDLIGPLDEENSRNNRAYLLLEKRAQQMKTFGTNKEQKKTTREEWMTELPDVRTSMLGLGPRQFRNKEGPDMGDRSVWTETPQDKIKESRKHKSKTDAKNEQKMKQIKERDLEQERIVEKYRKEKRGSTSLLDLHRKKVEKNKQDNKLSEKSERRPFSRDIDLKVNRFDEAQKNAILKKAQLLDDRFSSGKSKFL